MSAAASPVSRAARRRAGKSAGSSASGTSVYGFGHPLYYEGVVRALRGEAPPQIDGREGLKSLELLVAMYLSARDGKRINLPLAY